MSRGPHHSLVVVDQHIAAARDFEAIAPHHDGGVFVDPDAKFTTGSLEGTETGGIVKPIPSFYNPGQPLTVPNLMTGLNEHSVIVVVADREFLPGSINVKLRDFPLPDGGTVRASVGPSTTNDDVDRLAAALRAL